MLAKKVLTEFLVHIRKIKITEEHIAVLCYDLYY
jgi:hypothetical protein